MVDAARPQTPDLVRRVLLGQTDGTVTIYLRGCLQAALVATNNPFDALTWPDRGALDRWLNRAPTATLEALSRQGWGVVEASLDLAPVAPLAFAAPAPAVFADATAIG